MSAGTETAMFNGGEDWWRDFDNARATAELGRTGMAPLVEVKGIDGAMGLYLRANRQSLRPVLDSQVEIEASKSAKIASAHILRHSLNN